MSQSKAAKKLESMSFNELKNFKNEDGENEIIGGARALAILRAVEDMDPPDNKDDLFRWIEDIKGIGPKTAWALLAYLDPDDLESLREIERGAVDGTPVRPGLGAGE